MKKLLFCIAICLPLLARAQSKYDSNWLFGYPPNEPQNYFGGTLVSFDGSDHNISFFETEIAYSGDNASISDKYGNLVAYTNGCQIQNREHHLMENGDNINPGIAHQQQCSEASGYSNEQGSLFLPKPDSDSIYYLFHTRNGDANSIIKDLMYSVVDAQANGSPGKVDVKNQILRTDTFSGKISACRHANGRDWWLIIQENHKNAMIPTGEKGKYHLYLFDPYGIHYQGEQHIGQLFTYQSWVGQSCFSPDGKRYVNGNVYNGINLFDFDRCTGQLSNAQRLEFLADTMGAMGMAFSPNSRFLYVTTGIWIFQYDMESSDFVSSKTVVAKYDGALAPLPTTFYHLALAPDGKIYGTANFGVFVLHIIHNPNEKGLNCEVEQHGLLLATNHKYTLPNFPHYRLYDVPGSICDSLGIDVPIVGTGAPIRIEPKGMRLWPNPANDQIAIQLAPESAGQITLMDIAGKIWASKTKSLGEELALIQTESIPAGIYMISFRSANGELFTQKVAVQH